MASSTTKWRSGGAEATKVRADCIDRTGTATSNIGHLVSLQDLLTILSRVSSCCEAARFVTMLGVWLLIYC